MRVAVPEQKLVDEHRAEGKALGGDETCGGDRAVGVEDRLERLVEVIDGGGAPLVEGAAHRDAVARVGVAATPGGDQDPSVPAVQGAYVRRITAAPGRSRGDHGPAGKGADHR